MLIHEVSISLFSPLCLSFSLSLSLIIPTSSFVFSLLLFLLLLLLLLSLYIYTAHKTCSTQFLQMYVQIPFMLVLLYFARHYITVQGKDIYTASKVKHHPNIFLEKTVKLSKHEVFLVTFLKRDKVVTIYSKFRFDYH